jgi:hypothetical protein
VFSEKGGIETFEEPARMAAEAATPVRRSVSKWVIQEVQLALFEPFLFFLESEFLFLAGSNKDWERTGFLQVDGAESVTTDSWKGG